jgi:hypothetical protein
MMASSAPAPSIDRPVEGKVKNGLPIRRRRMGPTWFRSKGANTKMPHSP